MNILMFTNTYLPHVGGVARSVDAFAREFRRLGHRVLIVAPEYAGDAAPERDVVRVPAIQNFNGSDFSVRLPVPVILHRALEEFHADLVHAHHPFLLGDTAQRAAAMLGVPLVFTHHTMYERYTHYVPGDSPALQRFVIDLATHYANLCDQVFAPSQSIAHLLRQRGVTAPIKPVPTGVDLDQFSQGDGSQIRRELDIPADAFVVGHVGRLAPEKNLPYLAQSVACFLQAEPRAHFLVIGSGPSEPEIWQRCRRRRVADRLHCAGTCSGSSLVDAFHAMDVFAFASKSETQGMVLSEAMAARVPVVALDAPGAREVVRDRVNGRLLPAQSVTKFCQALAWVAAADRQALAQAAAETAAQFSMPRTAESALASYRQVVAARKSPGRTASVAEDQPWEMALRLIETEYQLWRNRAAAVATAVQPADPHRSRLVRWLTTGWRRLRRWTSRHEWAVRHLGLSRSQATAAEPGLIMIQVDGLSRTQLQAALRRRRLPFLRQLIHREGYLLHTLYSGLPSSTPAVQGELFYGVPTAVPAFSYFDRASRQVVRMYDPAAAGEVQRRLGQLGAGLLRGGSAYSNIYSGEADEAHFCASTMGWGDLLKAVHPLALMVFILLHLPSVVRVGSLLLLEFAVALIDFARGIIAGQDLWRELTFVPTRVGICILLRELVVIGASIDAARGLPIVHLNLLGYDEQAHRRGPASAFAHWSLKGIDDAIRRVTRTAHRSQRRRYEVWIYSDHGQERVTPYETLAGMPLTAAVERALREVQGASSHERESPGLPSLQAGVSYRRLRWVGGRRLQRMAGGHRLPGEPSVPSLSQPIVIGMGPVGHVYLPEQPRRVDSATRDRLAQKLVDAYGIPLVLAQQGQLVVAWTAQGVWHLPQDGVQVLGETHPFLDPAAADLAALCRHPDAGDLVLCGWCAGAQPISFPEENGAHAGAGPEETRAFAVLPSDVSAELVRYDFLRPSDLRRAALSRLRLAPEARHRPTAPACGPAATVFAHERSGGAVCRAEPATGAHDAAAPAVAQPTIGYYDQHAEEYIADTRAVSMDALYAPFLSHVPPGGRILDAGCGSGRDSRFFHQQGYHVTAIDASEQMARRASEWWGQPVEVRRLQEIDYLAEFDGVWASASLLHVPLAELDEVLQRIARALKEEGVLYMSFKLGAGERRDGERHYTDLCPAALAARLGAHPQLRAHRIWTSADVRQRPGVQWVHALVQKRSPRAGVAD